MTESPPNNEGNGRGAPRQRVVLSGKIVFGLPEMTLDCAVSDLSDTGARVRLEGPEPLRDPIYLIVVRQGLAFLAREAWRTGSVVGLEFSRRFDLANQTSEAPRLVRQIWVDQTRQGG